MLLCTVSKLRRCDPRLQVRAAAKEEERKAEEELHRRQLPLGTPADSGVWKMGLPSLGLGSLDLGACAPLADLVCLVS